MCPAVSHVIKGEAYAPSSGGRISGPGGFGNVLFLFYSSGALSYFSLGLLIYQYCLSGILSKHISDFNFYYRFIPF